MKLIITGNPGIGKSTLLAEIVDTLNLECGFITKQILNGNKRIGFEVISSGGSKVELAKLEGKLNNVGRYSVNLSKFEDFIDHESIKMNAGYIYLDEVGQMQLMSKKFTKLITKLFESESDLLVTLTMVFSNDTITKLKSYEDSIIFKLETDNYAQIKKCIIAAIKANKYTKQMNKHQLEEVYKIAKSLLDIDNYTSLFKLFNNAIKYVVENRISNNTSSYYVIGDNTKHHIENGISGLICDCDLFNGRGKYRLSGMCSHIIAINISRAN